jgi:hypothetical protein
VETAVLLPSDFSKLKHILEVSCFLPSAFLNPFSIPNALEVQDFGHRDTRIVVPLQLVKTLEPYVHLVPRRVVWQLEGAWLAEVSSIVVHQDTAKELD